MSGAISCDTETVSAQPGWYRDPNDASAELYWDGSAYTGRRVLDAEPKPVSQAMVAFPPPPRQKQYGSTTVAIPMKVFGHSAIVNDLDTVLNQWASQGWTLDKVVDLQSKDGAMQVRDRVTLLLVFWR